MSSHTKKPPKDPTTVTKELVMTTIRKVKEISAYELKLAVINSKRSHLQSSYGPAMTSLKEEGKITIKEGIVCLVN